VRILIIPQSNTHLIYLAWNLKSTFYSPRSVQIFSENNFLLIWLKAKTFLKYSFICPIN
jgi:hypothetical protein